MAEIKRRVCGGEERRRKKDEGECLNNKKFVKKPQEDKTLVNVFHDVIALLSLIRFSSFFLHMLAEKSCWLLFY